MARLRDTRYHARPARGGTPAPRGSAWLCRATPTPKLQRPLMACPRCCALYTRGAEYCGIHGLRLVAVDRDPLLGRLIDHYLIFEHVGDGGLGRVYRAGNIFLEQSVAIKVLWGDLASDRSASERFRLEAQAASMIKHANIVQVMDFGVSNEGLVFMVMEMLRGHTLQETMRLQKFSLERSRSIARQIASGLAAAHARGLVHRDLKPANIMLVGEDQVKILDFGLVTFRIEASEDPTRLTRPGEVFGTPAYMAPEQITGGEIDERTDLYALGAILYQLITGRPPFEGTIRDVMTKHLSVHPEPIHGYGPLGKLAMHLLEKMPEHRPSSALEVIDAIDRLDLMPVVRGQPAPSYEVSRAVSAPLSRSGSFGSPYARSAAGAHAYAPSPSASFGAFDDTKLRRPAPLPIPNLNFDRAELDFDDDFAAAGIRPRRSRAGLWVASAAVLALVAGAVVTRDQWINGPIGDGLARAGLDLRSSPPASTPPAMPEGAMAEAPPPAAPPPAPMNEESAAVTDEMGLAAAPEETAAIEEPAPPAPVAAPAPAPPPEPRRAAKNKRSSRRAAAAPDYDAMMDKAMRDAERAAREDMRRRGREDEQMEVDLGTPPISGKDLLDEETKDAFEDPVFELEQ